MVLRSARRASSAPGYWILTATSRPSDHTALCTWPMLAEATGASSNEVNRSRHLVPSWASSTRCTLLAGIGGASFCSLVSASRYGSPNSSGIAASITDNAWPTFIAPPLSSPRTVNNWLAAFSISSAWTSSFDLPVSRLPNPSAARPAKPTGMLASFALRAALLRLMSATSPSSMTGGPWPPSIWQHVLSARTQWMSRPLSHHDRAGVDVELQRGVQRLRRSGSRTGVRPADRADHPVDLAERHRRRGQQGRAVGHADGVAQLCGDGRPRRVAVPAVQIRTPQAAGNAGDDQRTDQADAVAHPDREVGDALAVQVAQHPRVGDQVVGQHHQVGFGGSHRRVRLAALLDPRARTAQRLDQQF